MFGARKTQQVLGVQGAIKHQLLFVLSCNGLGMMQSPHLIADAEKLFVISF